MSEYKAIPVKTAKEIADHFDKSIVIIFSYDPIYGMLHTTTYGNGPQDKIDAAQGGEIATKALGGITELRKDFQDYRLEVANRLLNALKIGIRIFKENNIDSSEVAMLKRTINEAERYIKV